MTEKRNNGWGLFVGLLAGGAAGYFLASDSGKKARKDAAKKLNKVGSEISASLRDQLDMASTKIEEAIGKAKSVAGDASTSFQKGMEKAKHKLDRKVEEAEEIATNATSRTTNRPN